MGNSCVMCKHFYIDGEGWELPQFNYPNCLKRKNYANLKSFPFVNTKCESYKKGEKDVYVSS